MKQELHTLLWHPSPPRFYLGSCRSNFYYLHHYRFYLFAYFLYVFLRTTASSNFQLTIAGFFDSYICMHCTLLYYDAILNMCFYQSGKDINFAINGCLFSSKSSSVSHFILLLSDQLMDTCWQYLWRLSYKTCNLIMSTMSRSPVLFIFFIYFLGNKPRDLILSTKSNSPVLLYLPGIKPRDLMLSTMSRSPIFVYFW